jgi:hypothetical protein
MKSQVLLTADYASVDQATGKLNILGAFNRIFAKQFPAVHPRMALVAKLVASDFAETTEPRPIEVTLTDADGTELFQVTGMVQLPIDKKGFRQDANIIVEINAIEFPRPGTYEFIVKCEHEVIGETTIELVPV